MKSRRKVERLELEGLLEEKKGDKATGGDGKGEEKLPVEV